MHTFNIRTDFTLKYNRVSYSYDRLSQAVSYWLHHINQNTDQNLIGVAYSGLSFSSVALLLALYISQRDFVHLGPIGKSITHDTQNKHQLSCIYVAGNAENDKHFYNVPQNCIRTDSWHHGYNIAQWPEREELKITFSNAQKIYAYTSGSTGLPKLVSMSATVEAASIAVAQRLFFDSNDYCVFFHNMSHQGVHTTAILPGMFTARVVSLAEIHTWNEEILHATHTQYFYTMKGVLDLPPTVRVITTGGDVLKSVFLEYVQQNCNYTHLYDIYGLTECLPPLAIRDVQTSEDLTKEFTWVNNNYSYDVDPDSKIVIKRPDGVVFETSDQAISTPAGLKFCGRKIPSIRVEGLLMTVIQFKEFFESSTGIVNYAIELNNNEYSLHVLHKDAAEVQNFISSNNVFINIVSVSYVNTNGGIKTVK